MLHIRFDVLFEDNHAVTDLISFPCTAAHVSGVYILLVRGWWWLEQVEDEKIKR